MPKKQRTEEQMLTCLRHAVLNGQIHKAAGDPVKVYSRYIRYALESFNRLDGIELTSEKAQGKKDVIRDHIVPHCFILNKLLSIKDVTNQSIKDVVNKYYRIGVITVEEDELLTKNGLKDEMPQNWDELNGDVYARYTAVGINLK